MVLILFFVGREGWCCCFEGWVRYPLDIEVAFVVGWPSMSHKKSPSLQFRLQPAVPSKVLFSARCCKKWPHYPLEKPIQKLQASRETCRRDVLPHWNSVGSVNATFSFVAEIPKSEHGSVCVKRLFFDIPNLQKPEVDLVDPIFTHLHKHT